MIPKPFPEICKSLLDIVYPRYCVHCCGVVEPGPFHFICSHCRAGIPYIEEPHCIGCGYPFWGQIELSRHCPKCRDLEPSFDEGRSLIMHRGVGATLVHALKYENASYLRPDLQWMLRRRMSLELWLGAARLVPVPLHSRKLRERGYNQSEQICRTMVGVFPHCQLDRLLIRLRDTETQTRLSARERRSNVKNAFALSAKAVLDSRLDYILVDDVFTTGSTLDACAAALKRAGAQQVRVFTLAHG
jgi:ComF family protein